MTNVVGIKGGVVNIHGEAIDTDIVANLRSFADRLERGELDMPERVILSIVLPDGRVAAHYFGRPAQTMHIVGEMYAAIHGTLAKSMV